jgi:hypothetical protein
MTPKLFPIRHADPVQNRDRCLPGRSGVGLACGGFGSGWLACLSGLQRGFVCRRHRGRGHFELAGREANRRSALREAAHAPHHHGASGGKRHILVVASEKLAGEELCEELRRAGGAGVELDVLAPILAPRSHYWASDVDREREEARADLMAYLHGGGPPPDVRSADGMGTGEN